MQKYNDDALYPYKLFFYDCVWEGDKIVYPASNCNAICQTDIITGNTVVIGRADEEKSWMLFCGIYKWREYLLLASRNARTALNLFNLKTSEWFYIPIDESKKEWLNFREDSVFEDNDFLYIFPFSSLVVLKVDMKKRNIDYLFYPDIEPESDMRGEIVSIENMIYIPIRHNRKIYKFNLHTERWTIVEVDTELGGIDTLCYDGNLFWMTGIGQMVCSWNEKNNKGISYTNFPERYKKLFVREGEEGFWFCNSVVYGTSIFFIPGDANMLIEFDIKSCQAKELFIEDEWEDEADTRVGRFSIVKYMGAKTNNNILMMLSNKNKNLIFIDMITKRIRRVELTLDIKEGLKKLILNLPVMHEGMIDLRRWLKCIDNEMCQYNKSDEDRKEFIGRKIYFSCQGLYVKN